MKHISVYKGEIVDTPLTRRQKIRVRIGLVLMVAGAILGAMWLATPQANADAVSYVTRLANAGYTGPVGTWVSIGFDICRLQANGVGQDLIASKIVLTTGAGIYTADAYEIIGIANEELCYLLNGQST